jgi:hypothetical protein
MATPPTPEELQRQFEKLQKLATALGKDLNRFNLKPIAEDTILIGELIEKWNTELNDALSSVNDLASGFKSVVQEISKSNVGINATKKTFNSLTSIAQQLAYEQSGINKLSEKELQTYLKKSLQAKQDAKTNNDILDQRKKALIQENKINEISFEQKKKNRAEIEKINGALIDNKSIMDEESAHYKDLLINLNRRINQEKEISKLMGLGGAAVEGTQKALNKMGFGGLSNALGLDEVKKKMRETSEEIEKSDGNANSFTNKFKVLKGGIKEAGQQLITSLKDPLVVVGFLVDQMFDALKKADTQAGQLAKAFGTSYSEATSLRGELNTVASLSGDVNMTTNALQESLIALNKEFGTAGMLNKGLLEDFTNMTKVIGYSNEAAIKLGTISQATGTDLSDNTSEILGTAKAFNITNDLALNEKEIVEGVAKASASVTLSLGMQPGRIAAAVAQAKSLGLELEQVEKISESLLNFESSISNELEAELLTGRSLNLEQARYYALTGNIEGVAKEIAKQNITAAEFGEMNMLQRKSIASAIGMEADELGKALITQEALSRIKVKDEKAAKEKFDQLVKIYGYEKAVKELGDEQYGNQLKSQDIQERFTASVEKLKEIFVTLAEPLLTGLDKAMNIITKIVGGFEKVKGIVKSIIGDKASNALGSLASVATIGSLTYILGKFLVSSITRGTDMNPTVVRLQGTTPGAEGLGDGGGLTSIKGIKDIFSKGRGGTLARGKALKGLTKFGKGAGWLSLLGAGLDLGTNLMDDNRSVGNAAAKTLDQNKFTAGGAALGGGIGALFGGIGAVPGALIGSGIGGLLDMTLGDSTQIVKDGIAPSNRGPFTIMDSYGGMAITSNGDNLAVSPNVRSITPPAVTVDTTSLAREMQAATKVLEKILNKDANIYLEADKINKGTNQSKFKIG